MLGDRVALLSDNADMISAVVHQMTPFSMIMHAAIENIHKKYPDENLPAGLSATIQELTSGIEDAAATVQRYCESSSSQQAAVATEFSLELDQRIE